MNSKKELRKLPNIHLMIKTPYTPLEAQSIAKKLKVRTLLAHAAPHLHNETDLAKILLYLQMKDKE